MIIEWNGDGNIFLFPKVSFAEKWARNAICDAFEEEGTKVAACRVCSLSWPRSSASGFLSGRRSMQKLPLARSWQAYEFNRLAHTPLLLEPPVTFVDRLVATRSPTKVPRISKSIQQSSFQVPETSLSAPRFSAVLGFQEFRRCCVAPCCFTACFDVHKPTCRSSIDRFRLEVFREQISLIAWD